MSELRSRTEAQLPSEAAQWLSEAVAKVEAEGLGCVPVLFPQLPRRTGREMLGGGRERVGDAEIDLGVWRRCDAAAHILLSRAGAPDALEVDLFQHGDLEERTMVLRAAAAMPVTDATVQLFGEAQRTNTQTHFEAALCDSDLAVRALRSGALSEDEFNRLLLKLAFVDLELDRVFGALECGNAELSRMLQGLATEREAAGRAVWTDTNRLIARAPTTGTLARLVGHLEHGDDRHRRAAAEGILHLQRADLAPFVRERLESEPRPEIRDLLEQALAK